VDGVPVDVPYIHLTALVPSQDVIQEFKVQTNNLGAEFSRFAGGVINLSTRSGGNEFHGTAYEYLRNKVLNANTFFSNAGGLERPAFTQNQFGGNIAGPIKRDKAFFYWGYEGYRMRTGRSFVFSTPTEAMRRGDFSELNTPIYDPFSVAGLNDLPRKPFPGNKIPASMLDPVALKMQSLFAAPNQPGYQNNYVTNPSAGGDQNQYNSRLDYNLSGKQRLFGRWTWWRNYNIGIDPMGTKAHLDAGPETSTTNQFVVADTYVFSANTILDVRAGVLRFVYDRVPASSGFDLTTWGFPAALNQQVVFHHVPYPCIQDYSVFCGGGTGSIIQARDENWSLLPSLTLVRGSHTLKIGGDVRRLVHNYAQSNNPSGSYSFDKSWTSSDPFKPAGGWGYASFLLGTAASGGVQSPALTAGQQIYRGVYISDSWQVSRKLNLNIGVRYEQPGPWSERFDRMSVWMLGAEHPYAKLTGMPLRGRLALVKSDLWPSRNNKELPKKLFAPRVGFAYRVDDKTVLRGGYGLVYLPNDVANGDNPGWDLLNSINTPMITSLDGVTPYRLLRNPFPDGLFVPGLRSEQVQLNLTGFGATAAIPNQPYPYMQQWNFNLQRQLPEGTLVDLAYVGAKGTHLYGGYQFDQLPDQYLSMGTALVETVPNPFYGIIKTGSLSGEKVQRGQLLRPYPQYTSVYDPTRARRDSIYHSMQMKIEKKFQGGGSVLASYTIGKTITNGATLTGWLEASSAGKYGSFNNLRAWRSLANFDVSQRLVISYVYDLPIGKGRKLGGRATGAVDKVLSGWGINGISTFQTGFPVYVSPSLNLSNSFGGGQYVYNNGKSAKLSGRHQDRLDRWFDTSVFSQAPAFTFGNTSPVLPDVRGPGVNNWDFAVFKKISITERANVQFRTEFFNLFNRVQFGQPSGTQGTPTFGFIRSQANEPRLVQFGLRFNY
jgi:hypothetical protein